MPNGVQPPGRRLLTPTAGEYWPMDLTLDEERARLRREYARLPGYVLRRRLREDHGVDVVAFLGAERAADQGALIDALVNAVCPRAWLDRRLREEG